MRSGRLVWCLFTVAACVATLAMAQEPAPTPAPPRPAEPGPGAVTAPGAVHVPEPAALPADMMPPAPNVPAASQATAPLAQPAAANNRDRCPQGGPCCPSNGAYRPGGWPLLRPIGSAFEEFFGCNDQCGETPFGVLVHAHVCRQIVNGAALRTVLYQYDFCDGGDASNLNPHGYRRLKDIVRIMQCGGPHPLVIERTAGNPGLDAARREYVLKLLAESDVAIPPQLVVIGVPEARSLNGNEAILIQSNFMRQIQAEGIGGRLQSGDISVYSPGAGGGGGGGAAAIGAAIGAGIGAAGGGGTTSPGY